MQSHASRHFVSDYLKDLHPDLSSPFRKEVDCREIAVAYGRRSVPKLVAVLRLPDHAPEDLAHCLRVFSSLLSCQEHKAEAVCLGAEEPLIRHICAPSEEVSALACAALSSMAQLFSGRQAAVQRGAIEALASVMPRIPEAATQCLMSISKTLDGAHAILASEAQVVQALADATQTQGPRPGVWLARQQAVYTLAMLTRCDQGILAALRADVPACVVRLSSEALRPPYEGASGASMRVSCAECLAHLSHHELGKAGIREAGAIDVLTRLLSASEGAAVAKAVHALMGMTTETSSKLLAMQAAGKRLIELLKGCPNMSTSVADDCRAVLLNAAEHPDARRVLAQLMSEGERDLFLGPLPLMAADYRMNVGVTL